MNSMAYDVAKLIAEIPDLNLVIGDNLFIDREPSTPSFCVTVFNTGGPSHGGTLNNDHFHYGNVQVRVRHLGSARAWIIIETIMNSLHGRVNFTWSESFYIFIKCTSNPALLEWDDNNRIKLIMNLGLQRR